MSFFNAMNASSSGLTAQRMRMDIISQNIANATTTSTASGGPYQRQAVIMAPKGDANFRDALDGALSQNPLTQGRRSFDRVNTIIDESRANAGNPNGGVRISQITTDTTQGPMVYDPTHPHANEDGYVQMPNVNIVYEMVNMMSASRSYEANMTALSTTRAMIQRTLEMGQAV